MISSPSSLPLRNLLLTIVACALTFFQGCGDGGGSTTGPIPVFSLYFSVAVADLNGDGKNDIIACYSFVDGPPPHPGFVAVYLQNQSKPGTFSRATYNVGNDPVSVVIGDLDGDGKPDIVTTNTILSALGKGSSNVSVLLQDPTKPGQFLSATNYDTGTAPTSVAMGDLNGDGKPDLAVADAGGISVLFQNPSVSGSFLPRTALSIGSSAASVAIADLNGDNKPDLIATTEGSVTILLQIPAVPGSFSSPTRYGAGLQPIFAAVADLNADGRPDLAVANLGSPSDGTTSSVSVLLQNPAALGDFLTAMNYRTGVRSSVVAIADLNSDGKADLVVANNGGLAGGCPPDCGTAGTGVSVLLQDPFSAGQFRAATNYVGTDQVLWVAIADIDGDNRPDLVISQGGGIVIRYQDPTAPGTFLPITPI